jgi:hypothetical protein
MTETLTIIEPVSTVVEVQAPTETVTFVESTIEVVELDGETVIVETEPTTEVVELEGDIVVVEQVPVTTVIEVGIGGPQGPPGSAGAAPQAYTHTQMIPASVWTIDHNLGYIPNIRVKNTLGETCWGEVDAPTVNQLVVTFSAAFAGWAYLS